MDSSKTKRDNAKHTLTNGRTPYSKEEKIEAGGPAQNSPVFDR
jgi:hypothetical protein